MSRKVMIRIMAILLALIMAGGVLTVAFQVFAADGSVQPIDAGDSFSKSVLVIFVVAALVLIGLGTSFFVNKRKK